MGAVSIDLPRAKHAHQPHAFCGKGKAVHTVYFGSSNALTVSKPRIKKTYCVFPYCEVNEKKMGRTLFKKQLEPVNKLSCFYSLDFDAQVILICRECIQATG